LQKEKQALEKVIRQEEKQSYSCPSDAAQALAHWCQTHQETYGIEAETVSEEVPPKRTTRGRPRKNEALPTPVTVYRNRIRLLPPAEEVLEERRYQESTFLLVTDILDHDRFSDIALLKGYKEQYRVEQRFRFLKSPYLVGPIYLQKPHRVQAFGFVMLLALLVYSFLEQLIRKAMKTQTEPLLLPGKRKSFQPTGLSILELLEEEYILHFPTEEGLFRQLPRNREAQLPRILQLLDLEENLYTPIKKDV
jgi:transposase